MYWLAIIVVFIGFLIIGAAILEGVTRPRWLTRVSRRERGLNAMRRMFK
jgi:hypothetical protein